MLAMSREIRTLEALRIVSVGNERDFCYILTADRADKPFDEFDPYDGGAGSPGEQAALRWLRARKESLANRAICREHDKEMERQYGKAKNGYRLLAGAGPEGWVRY